ncbi:MAG: DUF1572 family protein [Saprospiraceae bacterium]|nr:DUF1572 family protein [Saprospiraceae bacterium]
MIEVYHQLLITEVDRRLIQECQKRTLHCLDQLTEEQIWHKPNKHSNSMGNLVLHLCGNIKQWLHATLGNVEDNRQRQAEFDERGPISRDVLKQMVISLMQESARVLHSLTAEDLLKRYRVQGFEESGVAILVHVTEHFSYHVGQLTYYVKAVKDMDMGYYDGQDLDLVE